MIVKEFDANKDIQNLFCDFIKGTILSNVEAEHEFAEILKQDLLLLETKRDMNFIMNILVPILNAELDVPVCFHPYDS